MKCSYQRPLEKEIPRTEVTIISKYTKSEYNQLLDYITHQFDMPKSFILSHYHMKKDCPDFVEHELDAENLKVDSKVGVDEGLGWSPCRWIHTFYKHNDGNTS